MSRNSHRQVKRYSWSPVIDLTPGYDRNRFTKISEELDEFACGICHGIFKNPVVTECCGQTYCSVCINQWLKNSKTCPNDRKALTTIGLKEASKAFKNLLSNLKIKCDFESEGCDVLVKLSELNIHLKSCEYKPNSKCRKCGIQRDKVIDHECLKSLLDANKALEEEKSKLKLDFETKLKDNINDIRQTVQREFQMFKQQFTVEMEGRFQVFEQSLEGKLSAEHQTIEHTEYPKNDPWSDQNSEMFIDLETETIRHPLYESVQPPIFPWMRRN